MYDNPQRKKLYEFMAAERFAVAATNALDGPPESALLGFAVTPDLELIIETTDATRKCTNLRRDPRISFVIGWKDQRSLQYEGIADEPFGSELEKIKSAFFSTWPELHGHEDWPGLTYFRVKPRWIRFSNYYRPRSVEEISFETDEAAPIKRKGFGSRLRNLFAGATPGRNAGTD